MLLRFTPPPEHADCPYRQVHYGYDFSGGAVCDVKEKTHIKKLLNSGYFVCVEEQLHGNTRRHETAVALQDVNMPIKRKKKVRHGNDHQS